MKERFPGHKKFLNAVAASAMIFGGTACDSNVSPPNTEIPIEPATQSTPTASSSAGAPHPETITFPITSINSKGEFLNFPFSDKSNIKIQQGWTSNFDPNHHAIDYISGEQNHSQTWKKFQVVAAAAGLVCANPPDRLGNAVLEEFHLSDGRTGFIYYGHLSEIEKSIPDCSTTTRKKVSSQEPLGISGDSGTNPGWIHLHFSVNMSGKAVDPYGLEAEDINSYPNSNFSNGKTCKETHILINCPTETIPSPTTQAQKPKGSEETQSHLIVKLRYADGSPASASLLDLYEQPLDMNKDQSIWNGMGRGETDDTGTESFRVKPGKYVILFDQFKLNRIYGKRLTPTSLGPGISGIDVKPNMDTVNDITLGRVKVNINKDPQKPTQGFWKKDEPLSAQACIEIENPGPIDSTKCENIDQKGNVTFNVVEGNYVLTYSWYDSSHGWQHYYAKIGATKVNWGQTVQADCLAYAPADSKPSKAAECSIK